MSNDLTEGRSEANKTDPQALEGLWNVANNFTETMREQQKHNLAVQKMHHERASRHMEIQEKSVKLNYSIVAFVLLASVCFAGPLIFYSGKVAEGLGILSHIFAVGLGAVAGIGFERGRRRD